MLYELLFATGAATVLGVLDIVIKNPSKKETYRARLLQIRDMIDAAYGK